MSTYRLTTPMRDEEIKKLRAGDRVLISGKLFTARDAAHKKLVAQLATGQELPVELAGQVIYYSGPAPAKPGYALGPAGPTTSGRMDDLTIPLLEQGVKGLIGKGSRSQEVREGLQRFGAVYLAAVGGAAALLSRKIKKARVVAYPELGAEAIFELEVEDFPVFVVNDVYGNDLYLMSTDSREGNSYVNQK